MSSSGFLGKALLGVVAFAILTVAMTTRVPKWLTDFDQGFYITIAHDLDRHGVFSNGVFDETDSTVSPPPPGIYFGPVYPALVYAAMRIDPRFHRAVVCAVEAHHKKNDGKICEVYALPIHILHGLLLVLGVIAIAWSAELIVGGRLAFWSAGVAAISGLAFEADLFSFVMTESLTFSLYTIATAFLIAAMRTGRRAWYFAAGAAFGILCLTRASYLVLPPAIALIVPGSGFFIRGQHKPGWRDALVFLFAFAVIFSPWIARNAISAGKAKVSEEYGAAALIERFAFNGMTVREFGLAFPYCVPAIGPAFMNTLAGQDAMSRFEWDANGSFFKEGRARRMELIAQHRKLDPVIGEILRDELAQRGIQHVAVSIPLAWCGSWVSGMWSLLFLPLFVAGCVLAIRRGQLLLLFYAAPAFVMVALHAGVANHYPRYNLGLIGPYAVAGAMVLTAIVRRRDASPAPTQSSAPAA